MTIKNVVACRERANSPASKRQSVVGWGVVMASFHDRLKTGCEAVRPYLGAPPPPTARASCWIVDLTRPDDGGQSGWLV